jgi:N6-L-threonylcarbamoyladenine synthase
MTILGIESSCDETAAAVVRDGRTILSNIIATQIPFHAQYSGVVPEIASRKHTEWIMPVVTQALTDAGCTLDGIDAIAATNQPGLMGALLMGLTFGKTLAWAAGKPFIAVNHMLGHLYAAHLSEHIDYPYIGLLVSGGHSIICRVTGFDDMEVLGTTVDDAVGEAFDKVAKFYGFGYPGGAIIDKLAKEGDPKAAHFPLPTLKPEGTRACDVSYSGLKTAAIKGFPVAQARVFPKVRPMSRAPMSPGWFVAAMASMPSRVHPASARAWVTTGIIHSVCFRLAISGTTPLYCA